MPTPGVVWTVHVHERTDGIYVFRSESDADEFAQAVDRWRADGDTYPTIAEQTVCDRDDLNRLIEAEEEV